VSKFAKPADSKTDGKSGYFNAAEKPASYSRKEILKERGEKKRRNRMRKKERRSV
jgi:hypothetical protein